MALVEPQLHLAGHGLLRLLDKPIESLAQRREPLAVVNQVGVVERDLLLVVHRGAVERQRFELAMRRHDDRAARCLIAAARFHPDEAVLDQIDTADAVLAADAVQLLDDRSRAELLAVDARPAYPFRSRA